MTVILRDKGCMASTVGFYLVIVGAINWGLTGLGYFIGTNLNVVNMLFASIPSVEHIIYLAVGIAGAMTFMGCKCKKCMSCQVNSTCDAPKV